MFFSQFLSIVGIGCTVQHADNWIAHQEDFNSILSPLNKDTNAEACVATFSLHDKSKSSRSRVQYVLVCHESHLVSVYSKGRQTFWGRGQMRSNELGVGQTGNFFVKIK